MYQITNLSTLNNLQVLYGGSWWNVKKVDAGAQYAILFNNATDREITVSLKKGEVGVKLQYFHF